MTPLLIAQLDARDRALFVRWSCRDESSRRARRMWTLFTHAGGAWSSIFLVAVPLLLSGGENAVARHALAALALSHLIVQLVKRVVGRPRPSRGVGTVSLVAEPDQFSFPSGHSAAAMSVSVVYALAYPALAPVVIPCAIAVGLSRVWLGVHYPGDVLMGQVIAVLTAIPIAVR